MNDNEAIVAIAEALRSDPDFSGSVGQPASNDSRQSDGQALGTGRFHAASKTAIALDHGESLDSVRVPSKGGEPNGPASERPGLAPHLGGTSADSVALEAEGHCSVSEKVLRTRSADSDGIDAVKSDFADGESQSDRAAENVRFTQASLHAVSGVNAVLKPVWKNPVSVKESRSQVVGHPAEAAKPGFRAAKQVSLEPAGTPARLKTELVARRIETLKETSGAAPKPSNSVSDSSGTDEHDLEAAIEIARVAWRRAQRYAERATQIKEARATAPDGSLEDQVKEIEKKVRRVWKNAEAHQAAALSLLESSSVSDAAGAENRIATTRVSAEIALKKAGIELTRSPVARLPATRAPPSARSLPSLVPPLLPTPENAVTLAAPLRRKGVGPQVSFLLAVVMPVVLVGLYYLFVASDQYRSEMRFAVRGTERSALENLGLNAIPGAKEQAGDAYIVIDYIHSKQLLLDIQQKLGIDVRRFFSRPDIDFAYRIEPNMPLDKFIDYWRWMIDASYNSTTSITTFQVNAFSGEDSVTLANAVLKVSNELVNDLSTKARLQLIANAQNEVTRTEQRLVAARQAVALFRDTTQITDPIAQAAAELAIIQGLETKIIDAKSRRAVLLSTASPDSPSVRVLDRQIDADQAELDAKRRVIGSGGLATNGDGPTLTTKLTEYNALTLEEEFAAKAYTSALSSLETSQAEARRQDRYFAIAVEPNLPEIPLYPLGMINTIVAFFALVVMWVVGYLVTQAIRDHTV